MSERAKERVCRFSILQELGYLQQEFDKKTQKLPKKKSTMKIFTAITICLFTTAGQANAKDLRLTSLDAQNYVPYNRDYPISIQFDVANASKNDYEIIALCVTVEREKQKCHSKSSMVNWNARRLKIRENWKGEGEKKFRPM